MLTAVMQINMAFDVKMMVKKRPFLCVFCATDEFKAFYARLPQNYFLNMSTIQHLWSMDNMFQWRYEQLENSMRVLSRRAQRVIFKLFSLSKRCHRQPHLSGRRSGCNSQQKYFHCNYFFLYFLPSLNSLLKVSYVFGNTPGSISLLCG